MSAELIVSVSGIDGRTLSDLHDFRTELVGRSVPLSLFVAPRGKNDYRIDRDDDTAEWLRDRRRDGDAVVLHGFDEAATKRMRSEFATLAAHEANLRLMAADRMLEQTGLRTRLFAAPGWIASEGTVAALPANGFRLLIGPYAMTDLIGGGVVRSRVLGVGAGFLSEPWWCRTLVLSAERTARRAATVRIAIAAKHLGRPGVRHAMLDAVDLALMHGCHPAVYRWGADPALSEAA